MKYLLLGDEYKTLYVEDDNEALSFRYCINNDEWVPGGSDIWAARVGFDPYEPEDSIYRYGNSDCMKEIIYITLEEAESFIGKKISVKDIKKLFKW